MVTLYGTMKFAAFEKTAVSCFWTIIDVVDVIANATLSRCARVVLHW